MEGQGRLRHWALLVAIFALGLSAIGWSLLDHDAARSRSAPASGSPSLHPGERASADSVAGSRALLARSALEKMRAAAIAAQEERIDGRFANHGAPPHIAAAFARCYLRYESGELSPALGKRLAALSTHSLAASLLSAPARIPRGTPAPRERVLEVGQLRPIATPALAAFSASVVVEREGAPVVLGLVVIHTPAGLRVSRLGR